MSNNMIEPKTEREHNLLFLFIKKKKIKNLWEGMPQYRNSDTEET